MTRFPHQPSVSSPGPRPAAPRAAAADPRLLTLYRDLVALLQEHRGLYEQLDELSRRQSALIEAEETDPLLTVLAERQAIIDRLDHANRKLAPARQTWDRVGPEFSADDREHVRLLIDEVTRIAVGVAARDEQDRRRMESRRDEMADEMMSLNKSRRAFTAYGAPAGPVGARFQDRQG